MLLANVVVVGIEFVAFGVEEIPVKESLLIE